MRCEQTGTDPGDYRWLLEVRLVDCDGPPLVVVQLNPSTANDDRSDATVGKVEAWARRQECYSSVIFTNLFAMRTAKQDNLVELAGGEYERAVGSENDGWLRYAMAWASTSSRRGALQGVRSARGLHAGQARSSS